MVTYMKKNISYHLFLFLFTFTRGLVEIFSLVLLHQKGFSLNQLYLFLFVMYSFGVLVNYLSLKIHYKIVLGGSSLLYGISFIYLSSLSIKTSSLVLLAFILAGSNYSYHVIRHYLAFYMLDMKKAKTNFIVTITYIGIILSSIAGIFLIDYLPLHITGIIILILSLGGLLLIRKFPTSLKEKEDTSSEGIQISKRKVIFNILEQFKVVFLELQPLYLSLYVSNQISYVGIFNIVLNIASLIVVYFFLNKFRKFSFIYVTLMLGVVFVLKLNMESERWLLLLAFFEGVFVKVYENVSLDNLYDIGRNNVRKYLLVEELIFFVTKSLIILPLWLFNMDIKIFMYVCILGIVGSGFFIKQGKEAKS